MRAGQTIFIAPSEIQNTQHLLNTGWMLATLDNQVSGIIPVNYIQGPQQVRKSTDIPTELQATIPVPLAPVKEEQPLDLPTQQQIFEPKLSNIPTTTAGIDETFSELM